MTESMIVHAIFTPIGRCARIKVEGRAVDLCAGESLAVYLERTKVYEVTEGSIQLRYPDGFGGWASAVVFQNHRATIIPQPTTDRVVSQGLISPAVGVRGASGWRVTVESL